MPEDEPRDPFFWVPPRDAEGNIIRDPTNPDHRDRFEEPDLDDFDLEILDRITLFTTDERLSPDEPWTDPNVEWLDSEDDDGSDKREGGTPRPE